MDFWQTVLVLIRRWYITVPAFFGTLCFAAAAYFLAPVQYQSVGVLVLTTPLEGGTAATRPDQPNALTNPLLNFDRSLALTGSILIQQMNSSEAATALGITPESASRYEVTNGTTNPELLESGPFLFIQGTGPSPDEARSVAENASAMTADLLDRRQDQLEAPDSTHISIETVVPPHAGQPLRSNPMRAALAAGALAALLSLTAVYGFESATTHRRRRTLTMDNAHTERDSMVSGSTSGPVHGDALTRIVAGRPSGPHPSGSPPHPTTAGGERTPVAIHGRVVEHPGGRSKAGARGRHRRNARWRGGQPAPWRRRPTALLAWATDVEGQ